MVKSLSQLQQEKDYYAFKYSKTLSMLKKYKYIKD
jgi:hypothetical protein